MLIKLTITQLLMGLFEMGLSEKKLFHTSQRARIEWVNYHNNRNAENGEQNATSVKCRI